MNKTMNKTNPLARQAVAYLRGCVQVSLDDQLNAIRQHSERDGVTIIRMYADLSFSARKRASFDQLLTDLSRGQISTVYVHRLDRLTRNMSELALIVNQMKQRDVTLRSVLDKLDTSQPEGWLRLAMLGFTKAYRTARRYQHK